MRKIVFLVRHAEPRLVSGAKQGLSARGKDQARALSKVLSKHLLGHDSLILHSDTNRSKETAVLMQHALECHVQKAELRFKGAENLTSISPLSNYSNYKQSYKVLSIESPAEYATRMINLLKKTDNSEVILVSHEVPLRVLLDELTNRKFKEKVNHASCFRVIVDLDQFKNRVTKVEKIV